MAYGRKTGGRDIPKGTTLNPNGRPKLTEIEKQANKISREEIAELTILLKEKSIADIKKIISDPKTPAIRAIRLNKALNDYKNKKLDLIESLDMRNIGSPKQRVDVDMEGELKVSTTEKVSQAISKLKNTNG